MDTFNQFHFNVQKCNRLKSKKKLKCERLVCESDNLQLEIENVSKQELKIHKKRKKNIFVKGWWS